MSKNDTFFEEQRIASEIKTRIVAKCFSTWASIVGPTASQYGHKIAYIDLFSGPGRYDDGKPSTPIIILQTAINNLNTTSMLVSIFNDGDAAYATKLGHEINNLKNIHTLANPPTILNHQIGTGTAPQFLTTKLAPTFAFIDPFGYKGLTRDLINGLIKDWGSDCIFFFNYNQINRDITNERASEHIDALFGPNNACSLRKRIQGLPPHKREHCILDELINTIQEIGGKYTIQFKFMSSERDRPSHSLIYVTKSLKGYTAMKPIIAKESSTYDHGVPSFTYDLRRERENGFELGVEFHELKTSLLSTFKGMSVTIDDIYPSHSIGTNYLRSNYVDALHKLLDEGAISTTPAKKPRKGAFSNKIQIHF